MLLSQCKTGDLVRLPHHPAVVILDDLPAIPEGVDEQGLLQVAWRDPDRSPTGDPDSGITTMTAAARVELIHRPLE